MSDPVFDGSDSPAPAAEQPEVLPPESEASQALVHAREGSLPHTVFVLPVGEVALFPGMMIPIMVPTPKGRQTLERVADQNGLMGVVARREGAAEGPEPEELQEVGVLVRVLKTIRLPDDGLSIVVQVLRRMRVERWLRARPQLIARVEYPADVHEHPEEIEGLWRACQRVVADLIELSPSIPEELNIALLNMEGPARYADFVAANFNLRPEEKQEVMASFDVRHRLEVVLRGLHRELDLWKLGHKIQQEIQEKTTQQQKEYFLREQLKAIRRELGEEVDEKGLEIDRYKEKMARLTLSPEAGKVVNEQLKRLAVLPPEAAEYNVIRTYLDWLTDLPWGITTRDNPAIDRARRILDRDHQGLDEVKERIVEYLAVRKLKPDLKGSILCLAGPPGVGKTSLGRSIAEALGRNFFRFSLGGMRDEAEIKGHRRTYIGALPGKILQALKSAGSQNPVIMLDEIDKLGKDFRGDPASAMLEVLDPAQNHAFLDHYLDVPFDLSQVFFIATANVKDQIPGPLLDRMEVIDLPGYIPAEKLAIASRHLLPRQREAHGLERDQVKISRRALRTIITGYTREAGVRNLEREIGKVCRKVAARVARGETDPVAVTPENLETFLGTAPLTDEVTTRIRQPGVVTGLAWTPFGGDVLFVEAARMRGKGGLRVTGQLGDVMRESAEIALSYVRSQAPELAIDEQLFADYDLHVHFPAGAVPKDGPSAGVTITTALISLLTGRRCKPRVAMTGEMTLRGEVLPVGGIREKVVAAKRAGIKEIIIPKRNEKDLLEIPDHIRRGLTFHLAARYEDVRTVALA